MTPVILVVNSVKHLQNGSGEIIIKFGPFKVM